MFYFLYLKLAGNLGDGSKELLAFKVGILLLQLPLQNENDWSIKGQKIKVKELIYVRVVE